MLVKFLCMFRKYHQNFLYLYQFYSTFLYRGETRICVLVYIKILSISFFFQSPNHRLLCIKVLLPFVISILKNKIMLDNTFKLDFISFY